MVPFQLENSNIVVLRMHSAAQCPALDKGVPCPVHAPTNHPLRSWEQVWSEAAGFGRVCPTHDVIHPDPDDMAVVWLPGLCDCDERTPQKGERETVGARV